MKFIKNVSFEKWKINHPPDHDAKLYRELYPFHVFERIDFDELIIGREQKIEFNRIYYNVTINNIELQERGTYNTTFEMSTTPQSKTQSWKNRGWNLQFQIIYTKDDQFVTIFTKKDDPSKDYVKKFMNGNFQKLTNNRSLPLSEFLFRTLLLHLSEGNYPNGKHDILFPYNEIGERQITEHPQFKREKLDFAPIFSIERELWICYSFSEEKAHRLAFILANQCKSLIVVYCNPTYTNHQRCKHEGVDILSLYEYADRISNEIRKRYEGQIRFLQNHLNSQQIYDIEELKREIENPNNVIYEIKKSDLMEAISVMKIIPKDNLDLFYSLVSVNLINAFLSKQRKNKALNKKEKNLFQNMYSFKSYISDVLTTYISKNDSSIPIYIKDDLVIIEMLGYQFSFHNIPMNDILKKYELSAHNKEIIWSGKKLQPIAPLLLYYSRALRQKTPDLIKE